MPRAHSNLTTECWLPGLKWMTLVIAVLLAGMLAGYAASRSPVSGAFNRPAERNLGAEKVSVFFLFRHLEQKHGYDLIFSRSRKVTPLTFQGVVPLG